MEKVTDTSFKLRAYPSPAELEKRLAGVLPWQVEQSLAKTRLEEEDLLHLLSPAAGKYLEPMAHKARQLTRQRFGRIMKLYAPLYLSSECENACCYCGFSRTHATRRKTLTLEEVAQQGRYLAERGFKNLLLVSGESRRHVPVDFLEECIRALKPTFPEISMEVYPLAAQEYRQLAEAGLYGLALYQETYCPEVYQQVHPAGPKRDYQNRLEATERAAGISLRQVGLGVLLGLAPFRVDAFYLGLHARWMEKRYWRTSIGLSFPRLRNAGLAFQPPHPVADVDLVQMVLALRLFLPDAPFSLSTREPEELRRRLLALGFTQMSAESCTAPGGYGLPQGAAGQFEVEDTRSAEEIARELVVMGFEPVWKDWDKGFQDSTRIPAGITPHIQEKL